MITDFIWLMELVRTKILEGLILPQLRISYWDFCISLAAIGLVAVVLVNSVRVGGSAAIGSDERRKADEQKRENEARKHAEQEHRLSYAFYRDNRERNEAYDDRYRAEHGQKLKKR